MRVDGEVVSSSQLISNERPGCPVIYYSLLVLESVRIGVECLVIVDIGVDVHNNLFSYAVSNTNAVDISVHLHSVIIIF